MFYSVIEMGRVKRKCVFEHAQNVQTQIILCMRKVSSGHLLSIHFVVPMSLLADYEGAD